MKGRQIRSKKLRITRSNIENIAKINIRKDFIEILKNHPTLVITILYVYLSIIGMMYYYGLLNEFNVNIFDYSQISDFVYAPFRTPRIFMYPVVMIFLVYVLQFLLSILKIELLRANKINTNKKRRVKSKYKISDGTLRWQDNFIIKIYKTFKLIVIPFVFIAVAFLAQSTGKLQAEMLKDPQRMENNLDKINFVMEWLLDLRSERFNEVLLHIVIADSEVVKKGIIMSTMSSYVFFQNIDEYNINVIARDLIIQIDYPDSTYKNTITIKDSLSN